MVEIGKVDYSDFEVDKSAAYPTLKDRVVIITGAGQGIGRGYAHYFAAQGAIPVIAEINGEAGEKVADEVRTKHGDALAIQVDVTDLDSVTRLVNKVLSQRGRIDCLINNAAVFSKITMAPFWELPVDEWKAAVDVNITGAFYCARAVVSAMQEARWGRIVNVTTSMDTMYKVGFCPYGPAKAALEANTAIWAQELSGTGITVNVLTPGGATDTPMLAKLPFSRSSMIQPEVMQAPLKWLLSSDSDSVTGHRFIGVFWDPKKSPAEAAEESGGPAAWPDSGKPGVWPT